MFDIATDALRTFVFLHEHSLAEWASGFPVRLNSGKFLFDEPPANTRRKAAWARLIQKVYEVDPLECPNCGATMRIIALIDDPGLCGVFFIRRMSANGRGCVKTPQLSHPRSRLQTQCETPLTGLRADSVLLVSN